MNSNKPLLFVEKDDCCGCSACEAVCPINCIKMCMDEQGFYYPVIDYEKCIGCFKCIKLCPLKNK